MHILSGVMIGKFLLLYYSLETSKSYGQKKKKKKKKKQSGTGCRKGVDSKMGISLMSQENLHNFLFLGCHIYFLGIHIYFHR